MASRMNRILVVDDEPHVLSALGRSLRHEPYELISTTSAHAALTLLRGEEFDLVLSDLVMPEMSGLEFLGRAREVQPDAMRIMMTGNGAVDTVVSAINDGAIYRFVTKPWDNVDLRLTLRLCFDRLELVRENRHLLATLKAQMRGLSEYERRCRPLTTCLCVVEPS